MDLSYLVVSLIAVLIGLGVWLKAEFTPGKVWIKYVITLIVAAVAVGGVFMGLGLTL